MPNLFLKYPSLTNHYAVAKSRALSKYVMPTNEADLSRMYPSTLWYATEKIDGSNISINIDLDTGEWKVAKRSGLVENTPDGAPFSDVYNMVSEHDIKAIRNSLKYALRETHGVAHLYGELYGFKIQKQDYDLAKKRERGIRIFDAIIENPIPEYTLRLGRDDLFEAIAYTDLDMTPIIREGTLLELMNEEPYSESKLGGVSEGLVYKPVETTCIIPGETDFLGVKHKTEAYMETRGKSTKREPKPFKSSVDQNLYDAVKLYVTKQRVMNVLSHGIEASFDNFGNIMASVKADIIDEFEKENWNEFEKGPFFTDDLETIVNKELNKPISVVVREAIQELN